MTDDLKDVFIELMNIKPLFHRTELGASCEAFQTMTASDFVEVGAFLKLGMELISLMT
jgi:hypothetical protein